jgi:hypothetical protein
VAAVPVGRPAADSRRVGEASVGLSRSFPGYRMEANLPGHTVVMVPGTLMVPGVARAVYTFYYYALASDLETDRLRSDCDRYWGLREDTFAYKSGTHVSYWKCVFAIGPVWGAPAVGHLRRVVPHLLEPGE